MTQTIADPSVIKDYHAHVYYEAATTRDAAAALRDAIGGAFAVKLGNWHDDPVGPHPAGTYQVTFTAADFPQLVPWLMLNHGALSVLIHPNTGDAVGDHSGHALWLGERLPLKLDVLR